MNPLHQAIELSKVGAKHGGPFGAVVTRGTEIVGQGFHSVNSKRDPTAHAAVMAIRDAGRFLKTSNLSDCELHVSCEPCSMCVSAAYWAGITKIYYAASLTAAIAAGLSSVLEHLQIMPPEYMDFVQSQEPERLAAQLVFDVWKQQHSQHKE